LRLGHGDEAHRALRTSRSSRGFFDARAHGREAFRDPIDVVAHASTILRPERWPMCQAKRDLYVRERVNLCHEGGVFPWKDGAASWHDGCGTVTDAMRKLLVFLVLAD